MNTLLLFASFFLFAHFSLVSAESASCWKEYSAVKPACDASVLQRNTCTDPDLNSPCYQKNQVLMDACTKATTVLSMCLGLDTAPWKLESKIPGHLSCQEWKMLGIPGSAQNCVFPVTETAEKKMWCLNSAEEIAQIRSHPVDYVLDFDPSLCYPITEDDLKQFQSGLSLSSGSPLVTTVKKSEKKTEKKTPSPFALFGINPYEAWLAIRSFLYLNSSSFIEDTEMFVLNTTGHTAAFERMEKGREMKEGERVTSKVDTERRQVNRSEVSSQELKDVGAYARVDELLDRTPELTEEIVKKAQEEWKAMTENGNTGKAESPYRLDIVEGKIQMKLPGQNEWTDVKQGDRIPPGSTIFSGMDTTTVLSIRDKGVVEVLPFTEITISEQGLEDAAAEKKTTTDMQLRTGEIEINIDKGMFGPSFQISTTNAVAGVRGTHFWVSAKKDSKATVVGVYEGRVDVTDRKNDTTAVISPDGEKPGIAVVVGKISGTKLAAIGSVLMLILVGAGVIFLRKRVRKKRR